LPSIARIGTVFYAGVCVVALVWATAWGQWNTLFGESMPTGKSLLQGIGLGALIVVLCHLASLFVRPVRRASALMSRMIGPISIGQALWLAAISAFAEELLFRGALWPQLGLIGGAVFFGILHTIPVRALAGYPIFAFLAGIVLGMLREESGSLIPAVLCHFTVNAINLAWLGSLERRRLAQPHELPDQTPHPEVPINLPMPQNVDRGFPRTVWRYHLAVELEGTDRQNLPLCFESEELALFQVVAREEVYRQLRSGRFLFADEFDDPFVAFPDDVAAFSAYLFQIVTGIEISERRTDESTIDDVRAWKISSRRGEWVKVPLVVQHLEGSSFDVDPDREDLEVLAARWDSYPRWFQDGMRFKYPSLR
jgi:membrane protease YdiL (CAAX protease family)